MQSGTEYLLLLHALFYLHKNTSLFVHLYHTKGSMGVRERTLAFEDKVAQTECNIAHVWSIVSL
jgi:hypothetical protein